MEEEGSSWKEELEGSVLLFFGMNVLSYLKKGLIPSPPGQYIRYLLSIFREEGEGKEGTVVFLVREDGKSWQRDNILICQHKGSSYMVYILGKEGKEEDMIECKVPHLFAMLEFVAILNQGKQPLFTSVAEHAPLP